MADSRKLHIPKIIIVSPLTRDVEIGRMSLPVGPAEARPVFTLGRIGQRKGGEQQKTHLSSQVKPRHDQTCLLERR
jgi:hypothetical protein